MKLSASLSSLFVVLPLLSFVHAAAVPVAFDLEARAGNAQQNKGQQKFGGGRFGGFGGFGGFGQKGQNNQNKGGQNKGQNNQNKGQNNQNNGQNNQNKGQNNAGKANLGQNNAGNANNGDAQKSLTLDPRVIAKGFANNGQDKPDPGQVPSLTSTNNFINFCLTVPNLPITDGKQIRTGSCNPAPIGSIPSVDNMPSAKFVFPKNGDTVPVQQTFTVKMNIKNLETGNFVNANQNYFAAPQQLNAKGQIKGHSHIVIEKLTSLTQTTPTDARTFFFFKGLNAAAQGGALTAEVPGGVKEAGAYRLCSINTAANHQPAIVPIAQHGSLDDCIYFTATAGGAQNNGNNNNNANKGGQNNGQNGAAAGKGQQAGQQNKGQQAGQQNKGQQAGQQNKGQQAGQQNKGQQAKGQQNKGQQAKGQQAKGQQAKGQQAKGQQKGQQQKKKGRSL